MALLKEIVTLKPIAITVLCLILWTQTAHANGRFQIDLPDNDVGTGPAVAYVFGPKHGVSFNWDTSMSWSLFTSSINLKLNHYPLWDKTFGGPQAEFTFWYVFNIGGGVGYFWGNLNGPVLHSFFGFPFGDGGMPKFIKPFQSLYFEPYVRCNFFIPDGLQFFIEAGLMVKITTYSI